MIRLEPLLLCVAILSATTLARNINIPQLRSRLNMKQLLSHKRNHDLELNPCEADTPFLCKSTVKCISLNYICDGNFDCDDGFDENQAVCNAANRPAVEDIWQFLEVEKDWILDVLFDGIDPEFVAHTLAVSSGLEAVKAVLGLSEQAAKNLHTAFEAVETQDERPLIEIGMPENAWAETEFMLKKIVDSGFKI